MHLHSDCAPAPRHIPTATAGQRRSAPARYVQNGSASSTTRKPDKYPRVVPVVCCCTVICRLHRVPHSRHATKNRGSLPGDTSAQRFTYLWSHRYPVSAEEGPGRPPQFAQDPLCADTAWQTDWEVFKRLCLRSDGCLVYTGALRMVFDCSDIFQCQCSFKLDFALLVASRVPVARSLPCREPRPYNGPPLRYPLIVSGESKVCIIQVATSGHHEPRPPPCLCSVSQFHRHPFLPYHACPPLQR